MGIPYALVKRDKPEVFNLGKGSVVSGGWQEVLERRFGTRRGTFAGEIGTFLNPIDRLNETALTDRLTRFDNGVSGDALIVAKRIIEWMGDDTCFLTNGWEELEFMIEDEISEEEIAAEFDDLSPLLTVPLSTYQETGSVWH